MQYKYIIEQDGDGWLARFPDIPEAFTGACTLEELHDLIEDVLLCSFEGYLEDNESIPLPSPICAGDRFITVTPSVTAKIFLLNTMIEQGVTQAELAKRLNSRPQEMQRFVDIRHATKIDRLAEALGKMGKTLELVLT